MKAKTIFYCTQCGNETPKWQGQCSACGAWNTITEQPALARGGRSNGVRPTPVGVPTRKPKLVSALTLDQEIRFATGLDELDRVLGGGAVQGSLVLIGGAPGIGKSTLMLQICRQMCQAAKVLYVSGEESERQLKLRADRLGVGNLDLYLFAENNLETVIAAVEETAPDVLIVDSIQTMYHGDQTGSPGSISQVKECTMALMQLAKSRGTTIFVVGHVNKEGNLAGPKVLEHMVDCVLYFEGDRHMSHRILRAAKNRYGATNEIGVFEMAESGLLEVPNPSQMLLEGRLTDEPGTCVACVMEGARPVLAEVQALLTPTSFGNPRRSSNGFDYNRAMLLMAVLEKRGGLAVNTCDAYLNVIGGLYLDEPGADLAAVLALASSFRDKPVPADLAAIGEVGLTGELRSVSALNQRLSEVRRLGFTKCLVPQNRGREHTTPPAGLQLIPVKNIREALAVLL